MHPRGENGAGSPSVQTGGNELSNATLGGRRWLVKAARTPCSRVRATDTVASIDLLHLLQAQESDRSSDVHVGARPDEGTANAMKKNPKVARNPSPPTQADDDDVSRLGQPDDDAMEEKSTGFVSTEKVYSTLRSAIIAGKMPAGTRLVEEATARSLGVSRTPVREAIFRLEAERLVSRDPRGGVIVAELSSEEIEELYAVRAVLEGLSARLAVHMMLPKDFIRLEQIQEKLEDSTSKRNIDELVRLNLVFHDAILRVTKNATLIGFMGQIHNSLRRVSHTTLGYPGRAKETIGEHRNLIDALRAADADRAETAARHHVNNALRVRLLLSVREELDRTTLDDHDPMLP